MYVKLRPKLASRRTSPGFRVYACIASR